ncbi:UNVERIFIED_CONTAM: hypothetical protein FKN15_015182 [Acipenser sinensis]
MLQVPKTPLSKVTYKDKGFEGDTDYAVVQLPKPADNENQENKDSDYALIQEPKVAEQNCLANIDSDYAVVDLNTDEKKFDGSNDYAVVQKPKANEKKTKDSDYSLIQELEVFEQNPFTSKVSKGESATLYCNPSLQAGSQAQWTRRGVSGDKRVIVTRQEDGRVVKEIKDPQNRFQIHDCFNIHIERVDSGDLGTYECGGRETSLIVLTDPASHTVSEGESVTLHCGDSADLAGAGSVRWKQVNGGTDRPILYKDPAGKTVTQVNDPDHRYQLRPDSSLYIRKVKSADSGRYDCNGIHVADLKVLTDPHTSKESQYALVQLSKVDENKSQNSKEPEYELVKAPKEKLESQDIKESEYALVQAPKDVNTTKYTVSEGGSVILRCGVSPPDKSEFVTWKHTGFEETKTIAERYVSGETDIAAEQFQLHKDSTLQIDKVKRADAGSYKCNDEVVAELQVLPGPSSGSHRPQFYVSENETVSLRCLGAETHVQTVAWTRQDIAERATILLSREPNGKFKYGHKGQDMRMQVLEDNSLSIVGVQTQDTGTYQCNRNDVADLMVLSGPTLTIAIILIVVLLAVLALVHVADLKVLVAGPSSGSHRPQFYVSENETVSLRCLGAETHVQTVAWTRQDIAERATILLSREPNGKFKYGHKGQDMRMQVLEDNSLSIVGVQTQDTGTYQCNRNDVADLMVLSVHASGSGGEAKVEKGNGDGEILYTTPHILNKKGGPTQNHQSEPCVIYSAVVTQKGK